jgi:hypothetical protein
MIQLQNAAGVVLQVLRLSYVVRGGGSKPWSAEPAPLTHLPGQYAFINVPALSALEWHPFTIWWVA